MHKLTKPYFQPLFLLNQVIELGHGIYKDLLCKPCDKTFHTKSGLKIHINEIHKEDDDSVSSTTSTKEKIKSSNVNPFRSALKPATKTQCRIWSKRSFNSLEDDTERSINSPDDDSDNESRMDEMSPLASSKRVKVSDISITRYMEEFLEVEEISSGDFGSIRKAHHRLDGIVYAVKVTKLRGVITSTPKLTKKVNMSDEMVGMNEVFAHASLMNHKHVVTYYNSWVENGQVYIQSEYCEGGSLASQIEEFRKRRRFFTETELKKMVVDVTKGLQYIHSKQLVHRDIKPENIFISSDEGDYNEASTGDDSMDECNMFHYKIGDLGHVAPVFGEKKSPNEGDYRYMAPELYEMEVDRSQLTKADIFSLGLTVLEAAYLRPLSKNSLDNSKYELPYLVRYSRDFNNLIRSLLNPDPIFRPSANQLWANCIFNDDDADDIINPGINMTQSQLEKELKETREKILLLEQQVSQVEAGKENMINLNKQGGKRLVGRGTDKSISF